MLPTTKHNPKTNLPTTNYKLQTSKGFTLLELILYVSIAGVILLVVSIFLSTILQSRIKNQTVSEVEQQGAQVMQLITQTIRNAEDISAPSQGISGASLTLDVVDLSDDPTIFDLSSGVIRITEGVDSPINIINSRINVSGLSFHNLSKTDTAGTVKIVFTLSHKNPEGRNEYNFSKTFYGSASLR